MRLPTLTKELAILRIRIVLGLMVATFAAVSFALSPEIPHAESALPEKLDIRVSGKLIHGWRGAPESSGLINSGIEEENHPWEDEGFLYRPKGDDRDQFQVVAWSTKGRAGKILSSAENKLIDIIRASRPAEDDPGGYVFSGKKANRTLPPQHKYPKGLTVAQSMETLKMAQAKEAAKPTTQALTAPPRPAPVKIAETQKAAPGGDCLLPWLLFILALLVLLLWPVRAALKRPRRPRE